MNTFAPIKSDLPDARKPTPRVLAGNLWLEMQAGMDETAAYAQTLPVHIKPTDYDHLTTQAELRETTIRRMVNDHDQCDAVEWLVARGEISADLAERIEEVSLEMAEKRLNRSQA